MTLVYILIAIALFCILAYFFRAYIKGLFYDYIVDGVLSFADTLIGGFAGVDVGDFVAAIIIFTSYNKHMPLVYFNVSLVALFMAWEATNFFPLGLIPVFGEGLEIILGLFPIVALFQYFRSDKIASAKIEKTKHEIEDAKKFGVQLPSGTDKMLRELETLIEKKS